MPSALPFTAVGKMQPSKLGSTGTLCRAELAPLPFAGMSAGLPARHPCRLPCRCTAGGKMQPSKLGSTGTLCRAELAPLPFAGMPAGLPARRPCRLPRRCTAGRQNAAEQARLYRHPLQSGACSAAFRGNVSRIPGKASMPPAAPMHCGPAKRSRASSALQAPFVERSLLRCLSWECPPDSRQGIHATCRADALRAGKMQPSKPGSTGILCRAELAPLPFVGMPAGFPARHPCHLPRRCTAGGKMQPSKLGSTGTLCRAELAPLPFVGMSGIPATLAACLAKTRAIPEAAAPVPQACIGCGQARHQRTCDG